MAARSPHPLTRRRLLGGCAVLLSLSAGCAESAARVRTTDAPEQTDAPGRTDRPPSERGALTEFDPDRIAAVADVGSPSEAYEPHVLVVWNDAGTARDVAVGVVDDATGAAMLDETFALPADAAAEVRLREPSRYVYEVRPAGSPRGCRLSVPLEYFDCNRSRTNVAVRSDGTVAAAAVTTTMACQSTTSG